MEYAFFPGCQSQTEQYGSLLSAKEIMHAFGVELKNIEESSCCGYQSYRLSAPIKWNYLTARNLALAERMGLNILTICNDCYFSFKSIKKQLSEDPLMKKIIDDALKLEELEYKDNIEIKHIVNVLHDDIGIKRISELVIKPLTNYRFATQPGCHLFRPREFNTSEVAEHQKLDRLVKALGADVIDYPERLDCCGSSMYSKDDELTFEVPFRKIRSIKTNVDAVVTVCPHCYKTLNVAQLEKKYTSSSKEKRVPVIPYTQLLGIAMGIDDMKLGLQYNISPVDLFYQI